MRWAAPVSMDGEARHLLMFEACDGPLNSNMMCSQGMRSQNVDHYDNRYHLLGNVSLTQTVAFFPFPLSSPSRAKEICNEMRKGESFKKAHGRMRRQKQKENKTRKTRKRRKERKTSSKHVSGQLNDFEGGQVQEGSNSGFKRQT